MKCPRCLQSTKVARFTVLGPYLINDRKINWSEVLRTDYYFCRKCNVGFNREGKIDYEGDEDKIEINPYNNSRAFC